MPKKHPKFFLVLLMSRSKLSLSKKLANSMILTNDLCQPSVPPLLISMLPCRFHSLSVKDISLSFCLSVSLSLCRSVSLSVSLSGSLCLSLSQSLCLSVYIILSPLSLFLFLSISLFLCLCVSPSLSLSLFLFLSKSLSIIFQLWRKKIDRSNCLMDKINNGMKTKK